MPAGFAPSAGGVMQLVKFCHSPSRWLPLGAPTLLRLLLELPRAQEIAHRSPQLVILLSMLRRSHTCCAHPDPPQLLPQHLAQRARTQLTVARARVANED